MLRKTSFLLFYHPGNSEIKVVSDLFQKLHLVIYASQFIIIIPVSSDTLNLENVERKEKNYKKLNISRMKRPF